jgi:hypothetical protein
MGLDGFENPPVGAQGTISRPVFKSINYVPGTSGWAIFKNGNAEFNSLGGSFQITGSGVFFYIPNAGTGNLRMSITNADGVDPYGNSYKAGLFINQRQVWATGNGGHTVTLNPTGQTGPEILFTPSGFSSIAHFLADGAGNRLLFEPTAGSGAKFEANGPFVVTGGYQGVNTAQGAQPTFATTGAFVEYPSASWTPLTLLCPPSETIQINTILYGYNQNSAASTLAIGPKIKHGATVLQSPIVGVNSATVTPEGDAAGGPLNGNNHLKDVLYTVGQDILGGLAGQTITIIPCWRISSGDNTKATIANGSMTAFPLSYSIPQSG